MNFTCRCYLANVLIIKLVILTVILCDVINVVC